MTFQLPERPGPVSETAYWNILKDISKYVVERDNNQYNIREMKH